MRTLIWSLACCLSVVTAPAAMAQDRGLAIEYTVKVADIAIHLLDAIEAGEARFDELDAPLAQPIGVFPADGVSPAGKPSS